MRLSIAVMTLAFIGLLSSLMALKDYKAERPVCEIGKTWNCKVVYHIPQAELFGIHLTRASIVYFSMLSLLAILQVLWDFPRAILLAISCITLGGSALVPYLIYLEARVAHAFCLWCTVMHVVMVSLAVLSTYLYFTS
jgi:uncharacterized membrane protein